MLSAEASLRCPTRGGLEGIALLARRVFARCNRAREPDQQTLAALTINESRRPGIDQGQPSQNQGAKSPNSK